MTHLSEILKSELAKLRERTENTGGRLEIIETGTIRNTAENYRVNDGWSTLTFAEDAAEHDGSLTAIDLDVSAAREVIAGRGVASLVTLVKGHSIDILAGYLEANFVYDVAFLDSDNDAALILHEYLIVKRMMRSPGLIMVDDVDTESMGVVKGHEIVPWLDREGIPYRVEIRHGDGYRTGVLIIEV